MLVKFYKTQDPQRFRKISLGVMWLVLCVNGVLLCNHFKERESVLYQIKTAFMQLAADPLCNGRTLCFIGLPYEYFPSGVAQAAWLYGIDSKKPVYYDPSTFLWYKKKVSDNPLNIEMNGSVLTLKVLDAKDSWFNPFNQFCKMGLVTGDKIDRVSGMPAVLTYRFDEKYVQQNMLFITWDYKHWKFKFL
jgi:hypothetical protein